VRRPRKRVTAARGLLLICTCRIPHHLPSSRLLARSRPRYEERLPGGCRRQTDRCRAPRLTGPGQVVRPALACGVGAARWGCTTALAPATATLRSPWVAVQVLFRSGSVIAPMQAAGTSPSINKSSNRAEPRQGQPARQRRTEQACGYAPISGTVRTGGHGRSRQRWRSPWWRPWRRQVSGGEVSARVPMPVQGLPGDGVAGWSWRSPP
jgi:hypothetical protein